MAAAQADVPAVREASSPTNPKILPPARSDDVNVTVDTALGITAVYRAVMVLVTSVSQMDLGVYRAGVEIASPSLIKKPSLNDTRTAFVEETVYSLATYGNAYWYLRRDAAQTVQSIEVLDPSLMAADLDLASGRIAYSYNGSPMPAGKLKHLKLMRRPGRAVGLGPIQAAKSELTAAIRLRSFADTWFNTSGVPTGSLMTDLVLSPEESAAFAAAWKKFLRDNDGIAVLSQGLKYAPVHIKPAEAQFLEVQAAATTNIARLFGVPATYLLTDQGGTSNTYVNQQELNLIFLQTTLTRYMAEIENALTDLLPRGQEVRFQEAQLLRMNSLLRTQIDVALVEAGLRTVNELRARDHLEGLKGGDEPRNPAAKPAGATPALPAPGGGK